jgi:predicted nucleic acid-binding protein
MSHTLELTDEQFATLEAIAARTGQTPQKLIDRWVAALAESQGTIYYSADEMFEALDAYAARVDAEQEGQEESRPGQRE